MEIERKFLLKSLPKKCMDTMVIDSMATLIRQGYINMNPEVRIVSKHVFGKETKYMMTIKSDGLLSREEIEFNIDRDKFNKLRDNFIKDYSMINKMYYTFIDGDFLIEVSIVDIGTDTSFIYAEVEFKSEEDSKLYKLPDWFIEECSPIEITNDSSYKMKNYWLRTRLNT